MPDPDADSRTVRIEFDEDMPTVYATHLVVQHTPHEFVVNFFEVQPPLLVGTPEEKRARASTVTAIRGRGLVRVIVASTRMHEFVKVLQDNYKTFEQSVAEAQSAASAAAAGDDADATSKKGTH